MPHPTLISTSFTRLLLACLLAVSASARSADVEVLFGPDQPDPGGTVAPDELNTPFAVEFDADGRMLIVEYDGGRLLRVSTDGDLEVLAGDGRLGYSDGDPETARFNKLHNLAIGKDGRVFMSDHLNHAVRLYDPDNNNVSSFAGDGSEGDAGDGDSISDARFRQPICVTLSPDKKRLLIADIGNRRIREIELATKTIRTIAGTGEKGAPADGTSALEAPLLDPRAAAETPAGELYILERNGHVLRRVRDGRVETVAGDGKAGATDGPARTARFNGPKHLDIAPDGRVFIADDVNHRIRVYDPEADAVTTLDLGDYDLRRPHGVKIHDGWVYIADSFHHRILRTPLP